MVTVRWRLFNSNYLFGISGLAEACARLSAILVISAYQIAGRPPQYPQSAFRDVTLYASVPIPTTSHRRRDVAG